MEIDSICEKILINVPDLICAIGKDGYIVKVNEACKQLLGYDSYELEDKLFTDFVHPDDIHITQQTTRSVLSGSATCNFKNRYLHKNGYNVSLAWSAKWSEEEKLIFCTARDATEHDKVVEKETFYQALIEHGSDMMALLDETGNYLFVSGAIPRILGYTAKQLVGTNAFNLVHPDDVERVQELWSQFDHHAALLAADFRHKTVTGEWKWLEAVVSNQLQNPAIRGYVLSLRDITERKAGRLKLEESEQRYKALFDNNPDIVVFENSDGLVMDVNQAFRDFFGSGLEKVIGKPASSFLPPDMAAVNERSLQEALMGSTLRYDLELTTKGNKRSIFDTIKFPVTVAGNVIGAQTISKDITPIVHAFETIERQAKKLNTIFESITDAFFTLDKDWHYTYINSEFKRITGAKEQDYVGKHLLKVSEYGTDGIFYQQYLHAAETGESVRFEAYSQRINKWLEVKAFPSEEGLSVYFIDITDKVKVKEEVEKLSLVASSTDNGVVITDAAGIIEWVNESFTQITGYTLSEVAGKKPGKVLQGPETDQDIVKEISKNLQQGSHFNTSLINYRKSGEKFWVSMDITPIQNDAGTIIQFVAILRDITYRKEAEDSLLSLTQDLYLQNKNLQEFTYIVSHNLRAPVANALGLANILTKTAKSTVAFDDSLAYLKMSVLKMDTVLKDINLILSTKNKQGILETEQVKAVDVFWQAYVHLQEPALLCGGEVEVNLADDLYINANKPYLYSIFHNLLSNAIKFRSTKRPLRIKIGYLYGANGSTIISFSDNGTGFDTEKAGDDVFKLYKRFHKDKKGRGMGLFLVKAHVDAMGWKIEVNSRENEGTTFLIHLTT